MTGVLPTPLRYYVKLINIFNYHTDIITADSMNVCESVYLLLLYANTTELICQIFISYY